MSEQLPSRREALKILIQSGCSPPVIKHCKAVERLAVKIAENCRKGELNLDRQLVRIGALLHDIGRSKTHSVDHVIEGVRIAQSLGLPDPLVSIIGCHAGGGISPEEAKRLGWPPGRYVPQTLEEKIVTYADKLIEGSRKVEIEQTLEKFSRELGDSHPTIERMKKLHEEFSLLIGNSNARQHVT
ncbi:MAG: TIGR00295 family protein [Candidatus Bathyarchaeia archaeon]